MVHTNALKAVPFNFHTKWKEAPEGYGFSPYIISLHGTALQAAEKLGFVSGHDFSRAVND
jgi:hypothetical protein